MALIFQNGDMKIVSWNVNGIRAVITKGFHDFVKKEKPHVLCLQETRALPEQVELDLPGYASIWNPAERKGYSGTLVLTKLQPISHSTGIRNKDFDSEGRLITVEFDDFLLVNVYSPNAGRDLNRLDFRIAWEQAFLKYLKKLEKKKPVIFCGDTNVAHKEIDLANPRANKNNAGFTIQEREAFDKIIQSGFIDSFRVFNNDGGNYTWWSNRAGARERNIGWRIDYFCLSEVLRPRLKKAFIYSGVLGSDHCPVGIELK